MAATFGVLGPVVAWGDDGQMLVLGGPRQRSVLARLIAAHGRVVSVQQLAADLWPDPPEGAAGTIQTFVGALRKVIEPSRPPRTPAKILVTEGAGYVLRAEPDAVDAWQFERLVEEASALPAKAALDRLDVALSLWRGTPLAEMGQEAWAHTESSRLIELHHHAVECRARSRIALGHVAQAASELGDHVARHPWREEGWELLALSLYRAGRQVDALAVLRRARALLRDELGLEPSPGLRSLETDILNHSATLAPTTPEGTSAAQIWSRATADYGRATPIDAPSRLESTIDVVRSLAVTGPTGLRDAQTHRASVLAAADATGDAALIARVIGGYDVPAIWTRSDDPAQAQWIVALAQRALDALPEDRPLLRSRLLATIALESRGTGDVRVGALAREAEQLARRLGDPTALAFSLNGVWMQSFRGCGLATERAELGSELIELADRHDFASFAILGHLIRMQSRAAVADFGGADEDADAAQHLGDRHDRPLTRVFTTWYRAMRAHAQDGEWAYGEALDLLEDCGMPGLSGGLTTLTGLCRHLVHGTPAPALTSDWGPYRPWGAPLVHLAAGQSTKATAALQRLPNPPADLFQELLWVLASRAALAVGHADVIARALRALRPAADQLAGAQSGLLTLGPIQQTIEDLENSTASGDGR